LRCVLDASITVKWFVPEPLFGSARAVLGMLQSGELQLVAPGSLIAEYGHAFSTLVISGKVVADEAPALCWRSLRRLAERAMRLTIAHVAMFYDLPTWHSPSARSEGADGGRPTVSCGVDLPHGAALRMVGLSRTTLWSVQASLFSRPLQIS
jgi:hypothetical protein